MKIGVLACLYDCEELLPRVMEPWIALKNEGVDIVISAVHAQFKEYADLGFKDEDTGTVAALEQNRDIFHNLHLSKEPLSEAQARNVALIPLTRAEVDLVWLLDGDEVYTKEQIRGIINFIEKTPRFSYYHVPLKNIIFNNIHLDNGMCPPRIFRAKKHNGLGGFVWDNEVLFGDGVTASDLLPGIIPTRIAHVEHITWQRRGLEKKITYHHAHFGYCPFRINTSGTAEYDPEYFKRFGMSVPELPTGGTSVWARRALEVVFRSHASGNFRQGIQRITDTLGGKEELTVRSLRSVVHALLVLARAGSTDIRLTVVDDHSGESALARIQKELYICPFETKIISIEETGNSASLRAAFTHARTHGRDLVYFVEDDYLHERSALLEMLEAHALFGLNSGAPQRVALFPVDERDRYREAIEPSRVVLSTARHWRTIYRSTGTYLLTHALLEAHWELFSRFYQGENKEDESMNLVWRNHAMLFSPIPTLAYHMHRPEEMPPFSNWRKLWESLAVL